MQQTNANTLTEHYTQYFATPEQLEWYRLMAVDKAANVMELCESVPHARVLDVGAGDGAVLNQLDQRGFGEQLYAIDISESGLRAMKEKPWKRLAECKLFDGYNIPFPDDEFDLAVLSHVVEHVEHPRMLLREAARVAKHIYVEVPLEYNKGNTRLPQDFVLDATGHINFFDPVLIRLLLQSTGLRVLRLEVKPRIFVQSEGIKGKIKYWMKKAALGIGMNFATKRFTYHCSILCARDDDARR
jgi:ubiquinone/menaquinone biosynthesis C-methylase UbiE